MRSTIIKKIVPTALVAVVAVIASLIIVSAVGNTAALPNVVFADLLLLDAAAITCMAFALHASLKKTIYAYKNIGLIAGIIFVGVLAAVLVWSFVSCLASGGLTLEYLYDTVLSFPRHFSLYALFVIIALCAVVGVSNIELLRKEGFRPKNALSIVLALFYILLTVAVHLLSRLAESLIPADNVLLSVVSTMITTFFLIMLSYFECILVGTIIMGYVAARQHPAHDKDYIIILGCSIAKDGGLLPLLKGRVNRAVRFAWEQEIETGKPMKFVPTGGKGTAEVMSEGSAMELYLLTRGCERDEVYPEKMAFDTNENFRFSKKIIDELNPDAKIAFATTNYHMLRSGILAREAGIDAEGIAGDTKWYFWPNGFVREFFAILMMKMKTHAAVAGIVAVMCVLVGVLSYFGGMI